MSNRHPQNLPSPVANLRPEFVHLANRIAGKNRPLRFQWNGQAAEFSFSLLNAAPRGSWTLGLLLGGHEMQVELARLPDVAWVSPTLAGIDIHELPPELACALIESCLGEVFQALSKSGIDVSITSVAPFSHRSAPDEVIEWQVQRGGESGWMRGYVTGGDAALAHMANLVQSAPIVETPVDETLPMPVRVIAGQLRVPISTLQSLEVHDVLLAELGDHIKLHQSQLWSGGRAVATGTLEGRTFTVKQLNRPDPTTMADTATTTPVNDLEIDLTFVVGQSTLPLGEVRSLAPGFVFELPALIGEGVTIFANGKPIGTGELIEVGNRTGVRVTNFSAL